MLSPKVFHSILSITSFFWAVCQVWLQLVEFISHINWVEMGILKLIFIGFEAFFCDSWLAVDSWNKHFNFYWAVCQVWIQLVEIISHINWVEIRILKFTATSFEGNFSDSWLAVNSWNKYSNSWDKIFDLYTTSVKNFRMVFWVKVCFLKL